MKIIADLHIHSKYSRAVSQNMDLENIAFWAKKKGINLMGTGDFTHPKWFEEIKEKLEPAEPGLYVFKSQISNLKSQTPQENSKSQILNSETRFMLTAEISCIYSKNGRTRKIHNLVFSPSLEATEKINNKLQWIGNLKSDGRPILGLDSKKLLQIILEIDPRCVLVPAHAWTPWFSIFGSKSGFDSIEECFDEMAPRIFAVETGLSSDPALNWRLSGLDNISLISNSDSHSLQKIGREANVFDCELSYDGIFAAIKSRDPERFLFTVEFFPEEGRYHWTGHRICGISQGPEETKKNQAICLKCGKRLTVGVMDRIEELADKNSDRSKLSEGRIPYRSSIPLQEIIADALAVGPASKAVQGKYEELVNGLKNEFYVLFDASKEDITAFSNFRIAEGIMRVREGRVKLTPGYDGEYGKIKIFEEGEKTEDEERQNSLF